MKGPWISLPKLVFKCLLMQHFFFSLCVLMNAFKRFASFDEQPVQFLNWNANHLFLHRCMNNVNVQQLNPVVHFFTFYGCVWCSFRDAVIRWYFSIILENWEVSSVPSCHAIQIVKYRGITVSANDNVIFANLYKISDSSKTLYQDARRFPMCHNIVNF